MNCNWQKCLSYKMTVFCNLEKRQQVKRTVCIFNKILHNFVKAHSTHTHTHPWKKKLIHEVTLLNLIHSCIAFTKTIVPGMHHHHHHDHVKTILFYRLLNIAIQTLMRMQNCLNKEWQKKTKKNGGSEKRVNDSNGKMLKMQTANNKNKRHHQRE